MECSYIVSLGTGAGTWGKRGTSGDIANFVIILFSLALGCI